MVKQKKRNAWWTRERVILGLQRFYKDFGFCPTSAEHYSEKQQFTGIIRNGRVSTRGNDSKYPSFHSIGKFFKSMREAWAAAGFETDKHWEEWSEMEDWFILESVGVLMRCEVAEVLQRTEPAIKRRLYDLGRINSKNRWGMSITKAASLMQISGCVVRRYVEHGIIPVFRGHKNYYLNPADLVLIQEFDWSQKNISKELEKAVRLAQIQRICKILKFGADWRNHEIYKFQKKKAFYTGRIKNPRESALCKDLPPIPINLQTNDWVTVTSKINQVSPGRFGIVKSIHYSPYCQKRTDGENKACWVATVEFPKIRTITGEKDRRIRYSLPLDVLRKTDAPKPEPIPLKQNPEAVRSRERWGKRQQGCRQRYERVAAELT